MITRVQWRARAVTASLQVAFLIVSLTAPMTVSCQRAANDPNRGVDELRALVEASGGKPAAAELTRVESRYPKTRAAGLARFLRGYLAYSSQDYKSAIEALDARTIGSTTALSDYALFFRGESEAAAGLVSDARRDFGAVYADNTNSLKGREARLRAAEVATAAGDPSTAIKELSKMAEASDAGALLIIAQAEEARGGTDQAVAGYRRIFYELPATTASVKAEARLVALGASPKDRPGSFEEEYARCDSIFEARQYPEAAAAFEQLVARFPETGKLDKVHLRRGISQLNNRQPAQAVLSLWLVSDRNPEMRAEAMFNQAEALRRSNRSSEAAALADRLLVQYQKSRWSEDALYNLAHELDKQGNKTEAANRYRRLLAVYPKSKYSPEASYVLGWQAYQAKSYAEAARVLEQHLAAYRYPETKFIGEACFWAGKSEERLGNRARALALYDLVNERYRYGYHGYVAGLRASKLRAANAALKPEQAKPGSDLERIRNNVTYVEPIKESADGSEAERLAKADDLEVIGIADLAVKELTAALDRAPDSPKLNLRLAQFYSRRGESFQATLVLRRGYPDLYSYRESDVPREAWEIFFPLVSWAAIKEEAKRYGIDPFIAAGLIRQESVFNPNAVSRAGARGLMQVMPATGQLISKRQGSGAITAADLLNPTLNVKLGMNYLAQMLGQFGRIEYAAAAYNAGPSRAQRWISERGGMDIEDWIEAIPITETRGYVQGVLRYSANYRRFYRE
ncbi:MAG TPA: transglycosylase SLT domain-containing protein [Blastocatellia bacterium]|nr:transglycosylase SLT domain-containing protein [Blastocatellia bacterium]